EPHGKPRLLEHQRQCGPGPRSVVQPPGPRCQALHEGNRQPTQERAVARVMRGVVVLRVAGAFSDHIQMKGGVEEGESTALTAEIVPALPPGVERGTREVAQGAVRPLLRAIHRWP